MPSRSPPTLGLLSLAALHTGGTRVQDFVLMKAAETAKAVCATDFIVSGSQDASRQNTVVTAGSAQTTFSGGSAYTTFSPGSVHSYIKPGHDAYIAVLRVAPGARPPAGAISADEIIEFIGPRLRG